MRIFRITILFFVCLIAAGGFFVLLSFFDTSMNKLNNPDELLLEMPSAFAATRVASVQSGNS